jgi:hypothetical protein
MNDIASIRKTRGFVASATGVPGPALPAGVEVLRADGGAVADCVSEGKEKV